MAGPITTGDLVTALWLTEVERREPTGATVATAETETNTAYDNMATNGPAVTRTTGTSALVTISCQVSNSGANNTFMSFGVTGATTSAATDDRAILWNGTSAIQLSRTYLITGLTPGSNTFTAKYKVAAGTGSYTRREIIVSPQD